MASIEQNSKLLKAIRYINYLGEPFRNLKAKKKMGKRNEAYKCLLETMLRLSKQKIPESSQCRCLSVQESRADPFVNDRNSCAQTFRVQATK